MFSRKNIGAEPQKCEKCGSDKVFFVQHSHGNYPILDYVCPKCDLGGDQGGLQHAVLPAVGSDSADIVDPRGRLVAGPRDLRTILELLVVVKLPTTTGRASCRERV